MSDSQYEIIIFGATSFVGKILCKYLIQEYGTKELSWAIAGRSDAKLSQLKAELGDTAEKLDIIVSDANDTESLTEMCNQTKVIVSTVGPYALYGEALVKACVETGTDYCDLTGETQWIAEMIDKYQPQAVSNGARIVNCCGFDSIPSDLGVLFLQEQAKTQFDEYCYRVKMRVKAAKGGFSGGTVASLLNITKEAAKDPALKRQLSNPYALCPNNHPFFAHQASNAKAKYDADFSKWIAPFVMAAINTRVVHRSNALLDAKYGKNFLYDEAMLMKGKGAAKGMMMGLGAFMVAASVSPLRSFMEKFVLPKPGEGPSPTEQEEGYFNLVFFGETATGKTMRCKVTGDRDPGYGSTAKMLSETAIFLAREVTDEQKGDFWTPSTLMGMPLVTRLIEKAGLTFEIIE